MMGAARKCHPAILAAFFSMAASTFSSAQGTQTQIRGDAICVSVNVAAGAEPRLPHGPLASAEAPPSFGNAPRTKANGISDPATGTAAATAADYLVIAAGGETNGTFVPLEIEIGPMAAPTRSTIFLVPSVFSTVISTLRQTAPAHGMAGSGTFIIGYYRDGHSPEKYVVTVDQLGHLIDIIEAAFRARDIPIPLILKAFEVLSHPAP